MCPVLDRLYLTTYYMHVCCLYNPNLEPPRGLHLIIFQFYLSSCLQNEARKLNRQEVIEEDKRNKLPANFEAKRKKAEWEVQEEESRKVPAHYN